MAKIKTPPTDSLEKECWKEDKLLVGVDEAGCGPLAGSCFCAGVSFPNGYDFSQLKGLNDSKQLTESQIHNFSSKIKRDAQFFIISLTPQEIDEGSIYHSRFKKMSEAVQKYFGGNKYIVYMDGNVALKGVENSHCLVKGDSKCLSIAAASVLAKNAKNQEMIELDERHPEYKFAKNKGYGTKEHKEAIKKYGLTEHHRKSFCKKLINDQK